ncbi:MAG: hypothetical protein AAB131_03855 [Actinomycetota bacterium]
MRRRVLMVSAILGASVVVVPATTAADGTPVRGFGVHGVVVDDGFSDGHQVLAMHAAVQPDGKILVAGFISMPESGPFGDQHGFIARYSQTGVRDLQFGTDGLTYFPLNTFSQPQAVAVLPNGNIMVGGLFKQQNLWRLTPSGLIDPSFTWSGPSVLQLVPEPDGSVLVVGAAGGPPSPRIIAQRIDATGRLDAAYSGGIGTTLSPWAVPSFSAVLTTDGRLVVAGLVQAQPSYYCAVFAMTGEGRLDQGFADGGVFLPFGTRNSQCRVAAEPDGNVIVLATEIIPGAPSFTMTTTAIRVSRSGTVISNSVVPLSSTAVQLVAEGTGRLITAGLEGPTPGSAKIRAYESNGAPTTDFGGTGTNTWDFGTRADISGLLAAPSGDLLAYGQVAGPRSQSRTDALFLGRVSSPAGPAPRPPILPTTKFVPVTPDRILDTRSGIGAPRASVAPGTAIDVQVTGVGGVPSADVAAVVLNVTATVSTGRGYVSVYPTGVERPVVSNLNIDGVGQTAANLVTVKVGAAGRVSIYSQGGADIVADVAGYYVQSGATTAGRFVVAESPTRVLDSRAGLGAPAAKPGAGERLDVQILGNAPVPASGVAAVVLNLTATEATADGYVTAWPSGTDRPVVSNLNVVRGETRANLVVVPVGADGKISLFTQSGTHLLADVAGWFTDASAGTSSAGLFVPLTPTRILDTRRLAVDPFTSPSASSTQIGATTVVPPNAAAAVVLNLTTTDAASPGFITIWPGTLGRPEVSNLNVTSAGQVIPNASIVRLGNESVQFYLQAGGHLIADIAGWFTLN